MVSYLRVMRDVLGDEFLESAAVPFLYLRLLTAEDIWDLRVSLSSIIVLGDIVNLWDGRNIPRRFIEAFVISETPKSSLTRSWLSSNGGDLAFKLVLR
jgi:hypothetical protein